MRFVLVVLCAVVLQAQQNDWLIVPGERIGPIPTSVTRAGLDRLLGKDKVHDQLVDRGDGPEPGTVVFSETPGAALAIFWRDSRTVNDVRICYRPEDSPCRWHTKDDIILGTSLERLEALNGRAFEMTREGSWGAVTSWRSGRLAEVLGDGVNNRLRLRLGFRHPPEGYTAQQRRLVNEIDARKRDPLSSDLAVRQLQLFVSNMWLDCTITR